jgi:2-(1,2-epoxy-1,2-dihydrophenyl)acetyl-CoA isomerase
MLQGGSLSADDARAAGIVNEIAPDADFDAHVAAVASRIAAGPTLAYGQFKRLMDLDVPLAAHLEAEREAFVALTESADFQNATQAFVAKRRPSFSGC